MKLKPPYLIFLGDTTESAYAKTAFGLVQWTPDHCVGQWRLPSSTIDLGLPDMGIQEALACGANSVVIGVAPIAGAVQDNWIPVLLAAIEAGLDIVSGLHTRLCAIPQLRRAAEKHGTALVDVRVPPSDVTLATGKKRTGKRLLTVGTDCSAGKKYAALAITRAMRQRGVDCDFRATGQTGIMIAGAGIPMDAVVSDFLAGAAEMLSPDNHPEHWDVIEGQGSLFHPAYAGVSLGLLHGSQPDALVLCHNPLRDRLLGFANYTPADVNDCIRANLANGALTNADIRCVGVCANTSSMTPAQRASYLGELSEKTDLPCVDPLIDGTDAIIERLLLLTWKLNRSS